MLDLKEVFLLENFPAQALTGSKGVLSAITAFAAQAPLAMRAGKPARDNDCSHHHNRCARDGTTVIRSHRSLRPLAQGHLGKFGYKRIPGGRFGVSNRQQLGATLNTEIPYLIATGNLHKISDAIQRAGAPETFNVEFIKDLGFTSSQDRTMPKLLKYLGFLDGNGHPQAAYREFMDHTKAKQVLADRMRSAFDDLFVADKTAHSKTAEQLKGWFKTKTGARLNRHSSQRY